MTDNDGDHEYECEGCHEVFDDRTHPPTAEGAYFSEDGIGTLLCPRCSDHEPMEGDVHIPPAPRPNGTPLSQLSGRPGHPGFKEFCRIARSWGYP